MSDSGSGRRRRPLIALVAALAVVTALAGGVAHAAGARKRGSCPGTVGCIPKHQPDVNRDGKVVIGIISPGDTKDGGYYESFIVTARQFAKRNKWKLIIVDRVNPSDARAATRNICRQHVDMVAIGGVAQLPEALPVSEEPVCKNTVWYVAGGEGIKSTGYFFQTGDVTNESQYVTGVAAGEIMKQEGITKAGFVTGPELEFAVTAFKAFTAGIRSVVPNAQTVVTYTGDFDDSGIGREAAQAQLDQGVGLLYPYLGGATDAVVALGKSANVKSITPGTDRCAEDSFAISSIFSPGDYFAAALRDFERAKVKLGVTRVFRIGKDPVPTVKVCSNVNHASAIQARVDKVMKGVAAGQIDIDAQMAKLAST